MTAPEASPPLAIVTRPMSPEDQAYVWSTCRNATLTLFGGPFWTETRGDGKEVQVNFAHHEMVKHAVYAVLEASNVTVATYDGDYFVLGFAAWSEDRAIEFLYLRQSVVPRRGWDEAEWGLGLRTTAHPFTDREMAVGRRVAEALLGAERRFVARRPIHPRVLEIVAGAGYTPRVVPRSI